jgi:hypothetical protein
MGSINTNATLWANTQALMVNRWGEVNLNRLARECKIGPGTAARIKDQKTSVGLEVLEKIADNFSVAVWQLMVPGMDPAALPALQPVSAAERALYEKIMSAAKQIAAEPSVKDYLR